MHIDLLLRNGTVIDGSGAPPRQADVAITGDRIVAVEPLPDAQATETLDVTGLTVTPGFVDVHHHADGSFDRGILVNPGADNMIRMGVTTVVGGNCGRSPFPVADHFAQVEALSIRQNYAMLVGHRTLREQSGAAPDAITSPAETALMADLAEEALDQGALGISSGYFAPNITTEEIVETARGMQGRGIYASHIRDQVYDVIGSLKEAVHIGEEAGCAVEVAHIKTNGKLAWPLKDAMLAEVEAAVARGVAVGFDCYPYIASCTILGVLAPADVLATARGRGGAAHVTDADLSERARHGIAEQLDIFGGPDHVLLAPNDRDPQIEGKTLHEVAEENGEDPVEVALRLIVRDNVTAIYFGMKEETMRDFLRHPLCVIASDAGLRIPGDGVTHPRNYGTFPRVLGRYVRDERLFDLPTAMHKMTAQPAERFGIPERGRLSPGYFADITIFNAETVRDTATFTDGAQYPEGICHVVVNGRFAVRAGQTVGEGTGRVIRGNE